MPAPKKIMRQGISQPRESESSAGPKAAEGCFWADQIAEQLVARAKAAAKKEVVVRAGASPSGAKHIGNLFDVIKAYIVFKAVRDKLGFPAKFILTHDDRDPLRTVPAWLPSRTGQRIEMDAVMKDKFSKYLGHPYHKIPDPFDCCRTWAEHFSRVWEDGIVACGVREIEFVSNDLLYRQGRFDKPIEMIFENIEKARKIIAPFQENIKPDYVPFNAICQGCGKITAKVTGWDIKNRTVTYACEMKALAGKYLVQGCGKRGEVPWSEGKLVWRFEWPAQWAIAEADFEAFGKDHAEGSWPSGQAIARELYNIEPPVPHVYEFLLVNGEKMSTRLGNVYIAQEILEVIEPEVFIYFYTKRSKKQRNLDLKNIHLLVNDFERAERIYFGAEKEENKKELEQIKREYESSIAQVPKAQPLRIEYQFAALVSQFAVDIDHAISMLRQSGHIKHEKHLSPQEMSQIARRLSLAKNWVDKFAPESKITINDTVLKDAKEKLGNAQRAALRSLAKILESKTNQQELYDSFYKIAKDHNLDNKDFFSAAYRVLISQNSGPRLAPFIMALGADRVRRILEQV